MCHLSILVKVYLVWCQLLMVHELVDSRFPRVHTMQYAPASFAAVLLIVYLLCKIIRVLRLILTRKPHYRDDEDACQREQSQQFSELFPWYPSHDHHNQHNERQQCGRRQVFDHDEWN